MNKEQIYDDQISPLMQQIIAICQENSIAFFADFELGHDEGGPEGQDATNLRCTTIIGAEKDQLDALHSVCLKVVRGRSRLPGMMITTTDGDGSKTLTAVI